MLAFSASDQVVGDVFDDGEVGCGVSGSQTALVVAHHHVEHPMQGNSLHGALESGSSWHRIGPTVIDSQVLAMSSSSSQQDIAICNHADRITVFDNRQSANPFLFQLTVPTSKRLSAAYTEIGFLITSRTSIAHALERGNGSHRSTLT
jgi:hypothetical protein